jgi:hypothetical protein
MTTTVLLEGTVHTIPTDLRKALVSEPKAVVAWQSLTPLARNEWICWTISVKQAATREHHVEGVRRPCCWLGCIHRTDKAISPSVKWALSRGKNT